MKVKTMLTVSNGATTVTATYDALGRMVENNAGGTWTEFLYGPTGKLAKVNGQTLVKAFIALPGGAKAIYNSTGLAYFRHSDWLGSSRLTSTATKPTALYSSSAYAPFGEQYATAGTADASFTGQDQDTVSTLYDFPARRQSPSQGRWISPDPLGRGAVNLANPQTWNRYAYVLNNPLKLIDPVGLDSCSGDDDDDDSGGGGDDDDDDDDVGPPRADVAHHAHGLHSHRRAHAMGDGSDDCGGDDSSGDDNSGDDNNGNNCDDQCQAQQALQNALFAVLTNSNCAALIGGPSASGQAAAAGAIAGQLYGNPNPFIQFNAGPDNSVPANAIATTTPAQVPVNMGSTSVLLPGAIITLGPNFYDPTSYYPTSLSFAQNQEAGVLEEFGHALGDIGSGTQIMNDNSTNLAGVSVANGLLVDNTCISQPGNVPTQDSQVDGTIQ